VTGGSAGAVLDASALLAYLRDETGSAAVESALVGGAVINVVNYAEVLSRLGDTEADAAVIHRRLREAGIVGELLQVVPLVEEDAVVIARLRPVTRSRGLSLGDRACLATGLRLERPVFTADRDWAAVDVGVVVHLIRP
jgi:ribonuclease VapC